MMRAAGSRISSKTPLLLNGCFLTGFWFRFCFFGYFNSSFMRCSCRKSLSRHTDAGKLDS